MAATALITGGTSGIGLAFARRLAAEGYDLVLVARDACRLADTADELADQAGVSVEPLPADLVDETERALVEKRLADADRPVDLLVNNAGFGLNKPFWQCSVEEVDRQLELNVRALVRLTHVAVTAMLPRGRGDVINVSSVSAFTPGVRGGVYGAGKQLVNHLSESLGVQLAGTGVHVSALCPGFTRTEFHERGGMDMSKLPDRMWLDADEVVATGLRDHRRGKVISVPGAQYKAIVATTRFVPRGVLKAAAGVFKKKMLR